MYRMKYKNKLLTKVTLYNFEFTFSPKCTTYANFSANFYYTSMQTCNGNFPMRRHVIVKMYSKACTGILFV